MSLNGTVFLSAHKDRVLSICPSDTPPVTKLSFIDLNVYVIIRASVIYLSHRLGHDVDLLLFIPSHESLDQMSSFSMLTDSEYDFCFMPVFTGFYFAN